MSKRSAKGGRLWVLPWGGGHAEAAARRLREAVAQTLGSPRPAAVRAPAAVVVNLRVEPYDVYIGRAGRGSDGYFGNRHPVDWCSICNVRHERAGALAAFERDFRARIDADPEFRRRALDLRGKRLGCFCKPMICHGDVIVRWLEEQGK